MVCGRPSEGELLEHSRRLGDLALSRRFFRFELANRGVVLRSKGRGPLVLRVTSKDLLVRYHAAATGVMLAAKQESLPTWFDVLFPLVLMARGDVAFCCSPVSIEGGKNRGK